MATDQIIIKGARENNLKNVDLSIPRDKLIVFTGLSGSGKTSLAFDTIYAERSSGRRCAGPYSLISSPSRSTWPRETT